MLEGETGTLADPDAVAVEPTGSVDGDPAAMVTVPVALATRVVAVSLAGTVNTALRPSADGATVTVLSGEDHETPETGSVVSATPLRSSESAKVAEPPAVTLPIAIGFSKVKLRVKWS